MYKPLFDIEKYDDAEPMWKFLSMLESIIDCLAKISSMTKEEFDSNPMGPSTLRVVHALIRRLTVSDNFDTIDRNTRKEMVKVLEAEFRRIDEFYA